ncbi:MAG: hypothetical protein A3C15_02295 [Candidatus Magasanikbacteria bacterium RIFCSPHIGHO2_02_FULL_50_9b]|uniref:Uncharacterized protein n=1 Tax=Candidatus Magasanikbacteria bacterium RIFCSPHIGHO2_02_FULL_50_9b TaxID=1798682 RepID=A0A1F6M8Z6_9BACT|nr:MAG: hypothetical protein A3C15_02295 [Candidatus Magasanikbacteria bacterium RIFCSPHIGHO2_02_FULL_50_9b]
MGTKIFRTHKPSPAAAAVSAIDEPTLFMTQNNPREYHQSGAEMISKKSERNNLPTMGAVFAIRETSIPFI